MNNIVSVRRRAPCGNSARGVGESFYLSLLWWRDLICRDLHKKKSGCLYTPKIYPVWWWWVALFFFLNAALCAMGYGWLSFTFVWHEAVTVPLGVGQPLLAGLCTPVAVAGSWICVHPWLCQVHGSVHTRGCGRSVGLCTCLLWQAPRETVVTWASCCSPVTVCFCPGRLWHLWKNSRWGTGLLRMLLHIQMCIMGLPEFKQPVWCSVSCLPRGRQAFSLAFCLDQWIAPAFKTSTCNEKAFLTYSGFKGTFIILNLGKVSLSNRMH